MNLIQAIRESDFLKRHEFEIKKEKGFDSKKYYEPHFESIMVSESSYRIETVTNKNFIAWKIKNKIFLNCSYHEFKNIVLKQKKSQSSWRIMHYLGKIYVEIDDRWYPRVL